jgi:hypothetical protein
MPLPIVASPRTSGVTMDPGHRNDLFFTSNKVPSKAIEPAIKKGGPDIWTAL